MCELCTAPRPTGHTRPGRPDRLDRADRTDRADRADRAAGDPHRPQGVWSHLSGVRGEILLVPLPARPAAPGRPTSPDADDEGLRLVLRGDVTRQVLQWSTALGPDVLARVRVVCTADLIHLDDVGRALLVDLVRVAHRHGRCLHLPAPSAAATSVLVRFGLLGAVDTGPDPWSSGEAGSGGATP